MHFVWRLGYTLHDKGNVIQFLAGAYDLSLLQSTGWLQGSSSLLFNGYWGLYPWGKRPENDVNYSPVSSAKLKCAWGYTSLSHTPSYKIPLYINKRTSIFTHDTMKQEYLLKCSWESSLNELLQEIMQNIKAGTEGLNTISNPEIIHPFQMFCKCEEKLFSRYTYVAAFKLTSSNADYLKQPDMPKLQITIFRKAGQTYHYNK